MSTTRIYIVVDTRAPDAPARLIRATNVAQARNHAARDTFSVEVAGQDDLVTLVAAGIKVEDTKAEQA